MTLRRFRVLLAVVALVATVTSVVLGTGRPGPSDRGLRLAGGIRVAGHVDGAALLRPSADLAAPPAGDPRGMVRGEQQLTIDLLRALGDGTNRTVSPASLALALAMLQQGAGGATQRQIAAVLHTSELTSTQQGAAWRTLVDAWSAAAANDGFTLESANSLWQQRGLRVSPTYLAALDRYYRVGVWQVDFAHDAAGAARAINAWTDRSTHGRITKLFDPGALDSSTVAVLADAVYFTAKWAEQFDPALTRDAMFTTGTGGAVRAPFMHSDGVRRSAVTDGWSAVELPYRGGRFAALAIMPSHGSLADFTRTLTPDALRSITSRLAARDVGLALPKVRTASDLDLGAALQRLGMVDAFGPDADLSGISPGLSVSDVVQRTLLKVDERGTEAAAVTGIAMSAGAVMVPAQQITFDHPFLFLVRDTTTGAVLFASQIEDPTAG